MLFVLQVTDTGVCELARCCNLESLVLSGLSNVTDLSIFALANSCHYLKEIFMNGCSNISPVAVRYLTVSADNLSVLGLL